MGGGRGGGVGGGAFALRRVLSRQPFEGAEASSCVDPVAMAQVVTKTVSPYKFRLVYDVIRATPVYLVTAFFQVYDCVSVMCFIRSVRSCRDVAG